MEKCQQRTRKIYNVAQTKRSKKEALKSEQDGVSHVVVQTLAKLANLPGQCGVLPSVVQSKLEQLEPKTAKPLRANLKEQKQDCAKHLKHKAQKAQEQGCAKHCENCFRTETP